MTAKPLRVADLAERLGRNWEGDGDLWIGGVAPLADAGPTDLAFVRSKKWARGIRTSRAGALIVPLALELRGRTLIRSLSPDLDFGRSVAWIHPEPAPIPGIHASAQIAPGARVDPSASIGPQVSVGARSSLGARSVLHANVSVYEDVVIGEECRIHAGAVLREGTRVGDRVILHPGVVLGGDGFGYAGDETGRLAKIPQIGCVVVEDDVEIGANSTIDRATLGETRIRRGAKIDNLVMIAHNCDIGAGVVIAAQSGVAGSAVIGRGAMLRAQAGVGGHVTIGAGAFIAGRAGATTDVPAGARVGGFPAGDLNAWRRAQVAFRRLPRMLRRLAALERALGLPGSAPGEEEERDRE